MASDDRLSPNGEAEQSPTPSDATPGKIRRSLTRWLEEQKEAIELLPEKRVTRLEAAADKEAQEVAKLQCIDSESIPVVESAVRAAYWSNNSQASWSTVIREFSVEHPIYSLTASFIAFILSVKNLGPWLFGWEEMPGTPIGMAAVPLAIESLIPMFLIHGRILAIFRLINPWLPTAWRLISISGSIFLISWPGWRDDFNRLIVNLGGGPSKDAGDVYKYADAILIHGLKFFVFFVTLRLIMASLRALTYRVGPREPDDAVFSSRMILELLNLARLSQEAADGPIGGVSREGFRPYVASQERRQILQSLDRFGRIAGGRWRKSLRVGDHTADAAVVGIGDGIAASAEKWKAVAATGGERLPEIKQVFSTALVDAARGNWELLATEVSHKELLRRRALKIARHWLALFIMLGSAYLVLLDPFSWSDKSTNPAINSLILIFAAVLSVTIDPTIVERLGNAAKVAGNFSSKK
jgi:hypothetical protein